MILLALHLYLIILSLSSHTAHSDPAFENYRSSQGPELSDSIRYTTDPGKIHNLINYQFQDPVSRPTFLENKRESFTPDWPAGVCFSHF
ncbi:hypothetical protein NPIL_50881 [Nephila pilipes]|uniref:Uncharacterized protein n=1 Tax=Nephila pilipes TaxID=299642 RepID=A0A8X6NXG5_NEPPI|nr:hypothetical protein NPIL_50881 [Nephila pilipes]